MPDYTVLTVLAVVVVVVLELVWLRTGIFTSPQYWIAMAIVFAFQVLVDGWLTKLSDPIVIYNPDTMLGIRVPWDIPVEDFGFGFAMVTCAIMLWRRATGRSRASTQAEERE
jgi:lycopene cyclase domain-containing protein